MAVRTKLLSYGSSAAGGITIYTVPSGDTAIVKSASLFNEHAGGQQAITLAHRPVASGVDIYFLTLLVAANSARYEQVWQVMMPGDDLVLFGDGVHNIRWTISGTELEGVAD